MFRALQEYAITRGLSSLPGLNTKKIHWRIDLDSAGRCLGVTPLVDSNGEIGQLFLSVPEQKASVMNAGGRSHFMVETLDVVLLFGTEKLDAKKQRALRAKHDYFVSLLEESSGVYPPNGLCAQVLKDEELCAHIRHELANHKARPTQTVGFAVDDVLLITQKNWHEWWQERRAKEGTPSSAPGSAPLRERRMRCLMTGEMVVPVASHDRVKGLGVIGGQALSALVSFDKDSFLSFGLKHGYNAAMSETATKAYLDAMNDLVRNGTAYPDLGLMILTWYRDPLAETDDPAALMDARYGDAGDEDEEMERILADLDAHDPARKTAAEMRARELLRAVESGERQDLLGNRFHIIILSSAGARIMIRDYRELAFTELARNIDQWFADTRLVSLFSQGGILRAPRFRGLVASLASVHASGKLDWESVSPGLATDLYLSALMNRPIPFAALEKAVLRIRNEALTSGLLYKNRDAKVKRINYAALQLIRAYHVRKGRRDDRKTMENSILPGLNPDHPSVAYQLGRMMAVLADLQRYAIGRVGAGVIERFYGSFSTTPALVHGRLIKLAQNHLGQLKSTRQRNEFNRELSDISVRIKDNLPTTLTLEEQSLFALGYYQQMHRLIGKSMEDTARRKADNSVFGFESTEDHDEDMPEEVK